MEMNSEPLAMTFENLAANPVSLATSSKTKKIKGILGEKKEEPQERLLPI
jgi:hypothetical protein